MKTLISVAFCLFLSSCSYMKMGQSAYQAMPDENPVEEVAEWVLEQGAKFITGENAHIDLSGDTPEN